MLEQLEYSNDNVTYQFTIQSIRGETYVHSNCLRNGVKDSFLTEFIASYQIAREGITDCMAFAGATRTWK